MLFVMSKALNEVNEIELQMFLSNLTCNVCNLYNNLRYLLVVEGCTRYIICIYYITYIYDLYIHFIYMCIYIYATSNLLHNQCSMNIIINRGLNLLS